MHWWGAGCMVVLLVAVSFVQTGMAVSGGAGVPPADDRDISVVTVTVVNASGAVSGTATHMIFADGSAMPGESPADGIVTVTVIDSPRFIEVPGYMVVFLDGPLHTLSAADESARAADLAVSVYAVGAGEGDVVAIAFDSNTSETRDYAAATSQPAAGAFQEDRGESAKGPAPSISNGLPILPDLGGRNRYYLLDIAANTTSFWVDLAWSDPEKPLSLTIYRPGGVLGTYDDQSDGREDGRIYLKISNDAGIEEGNWFLKISGSETFTTRNYSFMTYLR